MSKSAVESPTGHRVSPVVLRTVTGSCHASNRGAVDWSALCGLVAHASHSLVVVSDPATLQTVQVLDRHRSAVTRLQWSRAPTRRHPADRLTLASADATGHVVVWNVKSGEVKALLQEGGKPVQEMAWMDGRVENTGHLLAVLHPPFSLVLWDTAAGTKVWKKTYTETIQGFDIDPFDPCKLVFRCIECILFIEDFHHSKAPTSSGKKFYVSGPPRGSPVRSVSGAVSGGDASSVPSTPLAPPHSQIGGEDKGRIARTRIKKMMKELVMGEHSGDAEDSFTLSECLQVKFHRAVKSHLLLSYPREVLILDLDLGQTVGVIAVERGAPNILSVFSCRQRDAVLLLTEGGSVSARVRKPGLGASSSGVAESSRKNQLGGGSVTVTPAALTPGAGSIQDEEGFFNGDSCLEIVYEQKGLSETVRLGKNGKVLGMAVNPMTESNLCVFVTDGRLLFLDLLADDASYPEKQPCLEDLFPYQSSAVPPGLPSPPVRLYISGIMTGLSAPPFITRMCPPLTMKNLSEYTPYLAVGAASGNVQVVNVSTGKIEREFAVHTFPVRGIEWTSLGSILSHAHQNLSGSGGPGGGGSGTLVRNELVLTDIRTGKVDALRVNRSEEPPIEMLRVSHLKQYFIVAFFGAPFELWDLRSMTLLRTMPKKFPPITALDWSPLHNLKSLKKKQQQMSDGSETKSDDASESNNKPAAADQPLIAKEHFVFTDPEGQLYHFSVEGNAIRDGTKVPAEASLGTITCIAWKSDHIVRGDSDGNLNVWDVRTRTSRNIATNRGPVRKTRFAPGKGNFKLLVLHPEAVAIWDVRECEMINELRSPKDVTRVVDVEWAASDRAVLATADGCLRIMGLAMAAATSGMLDYNLDLTVRCHALLPNKARANFHLLLNHQPWKERYTLEFTEKDGFAASELEFVREQIEHFPADVRAVLTNETTTTPQRCLLAARCAGLMWEADFWTVAASKLEGGRVGELDSRFDLARSCAAFRDCQHERVRLHETRCGGSRAQRAKVVSQLLCLGQTDEAVRLLLDGEADGPHYYEDSLKACLVATAATSPRDTPHSTTKLVATNLIAEGRLWEGVQLLCLIDKVVDACKYLQSCGRWDESLWLAKCRLSGKELGEVAQRYCDHCAAREQKKAAALVHLSLGDFVSTLDVLLAAKDVCLAAPFLQACVEAGAMPDTSHAMVLAEEISLAYARRLFDCGNAAGAFYYCDRADEKGEILKRELQAMQGSHSVEHTEG